MKYRKRFWFKCIAVFACINLLAQTFYPTIAFALTGGPSQPEMKGFEPIGITNMVDLSTGSFTYNIPLMDVDGYPINLSYRSGVTMDQEASWVGLGWSINPGEINRQMRGLPDEFKGDAVVQNYNIKDNITVGFSAGVGLKVEGFPLGLNNASIGIFTNNYKGPGVEFGIDPSISAGIPVLGSLTGSLGVNFNSQSGVDIAPQVGLSHEACDVDNSSINPGISVGASYNSRTGVKSLSMSADVNVDNDDEPGKNEGSGSIPFSTQSFSNPTYTPSMSMPLVNYSATADVTLGLAVFGVHPNVTITGWWSQQSLATHTLSLPAYGYMYSDQSKDNPYALLDFNREKDIPFQQNVANLPITNFTYDLFSVNGQGVSGQFRPFRGDVGVLYDHYNYDQSTSASLGLELGITEVSHTGANITVTNSNTISDKWTGNNEFTTDVDFQSLQPNNINYEPFYFKQIGEKTINDVNYYNKIGDVNPIYVQLNQSGSDVTAQNNYIIGNGNLPVGGNLVKTQRERRNQSFSMLNAGEASYFALDKNILSYPLNTNVFSSLCASSPLIQKIPRLYWPAHHTSEITVLNPDGKRYVYGIPAYNLLQDEVTFSVHGTEADYAADSVNIIKYDKSSDNTIKNVKGLNNYLNEQRIPSFAHSYLLTGVLSPDYVDLTGNGITDDDLGEAVKLNYTRVYSGSNPYNWRVPCEKDTANYQMGLLTDTADDKGNYMYGKKEIWYVHSIESKTMVAQFIVENRYDGLGVVDSNGGADASKPLKCVKEIKLYSKADLIQNGVNAVPIKTVHFVYDYSLCRGVPNSDSAATGKRTGKLTLKQVYFTYGNNTEGSLNSYTFNYSGFNPNYNHNRYDRWGYYKYNTNGMPSNEDFPYTIQDSAETNLFSTAWNLTDIDLPSGGHIKVNYESNDYAYVQNQRAAQMFLIDGVSNLPGGSPTNTLYSNSSNYNNWIHITLPVPEYNINSFYNDYLAGVDVSGQSKMYFRFLVDVNGQGKFEYVPGYADISNTTCHMIDAYHWSIQIAQVGTGDNSVSNANPIALSAWQFVRLNMPQYAYPGSTTNGGVLGIIEGLLGILTSVVQVFQGFDGYCVNNNFGKNIVPSHSYIRLDNPSYKKLGGGNRVKEIDISDNWASMVNNLQSSYTYGQTYSYTTIMGNRTISSGVATYEPLIGGDENSCRQPLPYDEKYLCAPDNKMYTETPLGESLYPAAGIVYGKVTVTNIAHPGVSRTATGYTVNTFYTARDFPVLNKWTYMPVIRIKPSVLSQMFGFDAQDFMNVSQGFTIEVNDMPGKEEGQSVYDANGSLISSVNYSYNVDNPSASPSLHLNNNVSVVNPDGTIGSASIGKDIDMWEDMREQDSQTQAYTLEINNEFSIFPFIAIPIDIFPIFPKCTSQHNQFHSAVTVKYINRTGLLSKVTKTQYGSMTTTQNLLYDSETGEVLLTQSNNEFDEPIYNFTYPAHWVYDGMGPAYKNIGFTTKGVTISSGAIPSMYNSYFSPGDEIEAYVGGTLQSSRYWVTEANTGQLILMDGTGALANMTASSLKVIRSGRRNISSTPIGTLETMNLPEGSGHISVTSSDLVLQANATQFNDAWQVPTNNVLTQVCDTGGGLSYSCVANFLDSLLVHHQFFATPLDNITLGRYCPLCGDTGALYYALVPPIGYDKVSSAFSAQFGNCVLNFTDLSGFPYDIYGSTMFYYNPLGYPCIGFSDVGRMCMSCQTCTDVCTNLSIGAPFNPYAIGMLGNWRPEKNYVYYTDRTPYPYLYTSTSDIHHTDIGQRGTFQQFNPFWTESSPVWNINPYLDPNWTWTNQVTKYDEKGNEVEDLNPLGNYSSALYGYLESVPTAVASNASFRDISFDGFEDYGYSTFCGNICANDHWDFNPPTTPCTVSTDVAHTGIYSLKIPSTQKSVVTRSINYYNDSLYRTTPGGQYELLAGGTLPLFSPDSGKYLISAWVNENQSCPNGYPKDSITVQIGSTIHTFHTSGPVIDGWQRFEGTFSIPGSATNIIVSLVAGGGHTAYFDDVRIQPFAGEMKTYVYDPTSMRLMATLDENNYATFYEYNDEGILIRVKKETEKGIKTIKESRSSYPRL
ncbi:MAG TPA: hypothetical protein VK809_02850 [Bacteroidia bacterium]|nr:hypothetical protein [Bacteroidia bacterium]